MGAACISGSKAEVMEDLDSSAKEDSGFMGSHLKQIKQWLLSHSQHLNFFTILVLASVPNPLFDLAGIMCGQFGIPFWKFFSATVIGKAIVKTHIQTAFIISVCNNQLLDLIENELIWMLSFIPGIASILPSLIAKLHIAKEKYMTSSRLVSSNIKALLPSFILDSRGKKSNFLNFETIFNLVLQMHKFTGSVVTVVVLCVMMNAQMGSHEQSLSPSILAGIHEKHQREIELLTLTTQPLKTLKLFSLAIIQYLQRPMLYISRKCGWFMLLSILGGVVLVITNSRAHGEHVMELVNYLHFGLWWLALGVASSIGLGSGLHTFVLYLGPHIALFTMKSVHCGRVDIKSAPYDTIQLRRGPSWLDRDCSEYGPPVYSSPGSRVPLTSILHQVQLEAILWGVGTALGELPPYFISRAACISGSKAEVMEDLDSSAKEDSGFMGSHLKQIKQWLLSHSQHLNFFTILVLASVPNPLFDLAGIMCGQFGIPFWKFFSATVIGKAIVKTHIQTAFIISVCNNQLLDLIENELIWMLSFIPGIASILPSLIAKLHIAKEKYMTSSRPVSSNIKAEKWDFSIASIWNTVVWLVLINFSIKIVTATAQSFLKEQQEKELATLTNCLSASNPTSGETKPKPPSG